MSGRVSCATAFAAALFSSVRAIAAGPADCDALVHASAPVGMVPGTSITSAKYVTSSAANYCEVSATVAPEHDVLVRLPDQWLGRYVQLGGIGFDGRFPDLDRVFAASGANPIADGFVVAGDNGGHRGSQHPGASFANDRGLTLGYATAKVYDTNGVASSLIQRYYGRPARYRYFTGCSNGGKNASVAAANFADYFDGIIGGDGVWGHADDPVGGSDMTGLISKWSQSVQVGALTPEKGAALHNATVQACDGLDGIKDGVVSNVRACPFTRIAASLRCAGTDSGVCLNESDLDKVRAHTSPLLLGRRVIGAPWPGAANLAEVGDSALPAGFLAMAFRSSTPMDPLAYDIGAQFEAVKAVMDGVYNMTGSLDGVLTYLRRGKKLFLYHGWEDTTVSANVSIGFLTAVVRSDRKASANSRLYLAPGVGHCGGGSGADSMQLLKVMSAWVERDLVPGSAGSPTVAWKPAGGGSPADLGSAQFSRPLCAYPQFPQYRGKGDPNQAASYVCRH